MPEFAFDRGERVLDPGTGQTGTVSKVQLDEDGENYFVELPHSSRWIRGKDLRKAQC